VSSVVHTGRAIIGVDPTEMTYALALILESKRDVLDRTHVSALDGALPDCEFIFDSFLQKPEKRRSVECFGSACHSRGHSLDVMIPAGNWSGFQVKGSNQSATTISLTDIGNNICYPLGPLGSVVDVFGNRPE
jgi:hypothetical protein